MMFKKIIYHLPFTLFAFCSLFFVLCSAQESDQKINDFSLTGYGEKGKKNWDLSGKSADIFEEVVKLKDVIGNLYGKEEDIRLTAERGDFNKGNGKVHLEEDVVITTSTGTKLTTDSLDWDRRGRLLTTRDTVNIEKQNMTIVAKGIKGEPNLKKVALEKEVRLDIKSVNSNIEANSIKTQETDDAGSKDKMVITCDGPLEVDYDKNIAIFINNVKVERPDSTIYSDKMDVFFIPSGKGEKESKEASGVSNSSFMGTSIDKIIAKGNVKIVRGANLSYSDEAIYTASDKKIVLTGRPKLILYSTEELSASFGN